jgi:hypothetical protein
MRTGFMSARILNLRSYCRGETVFSPEFKTPKGRLHRIAPTNTNAKIQMHFKRV